MKKWLHQLVTETPTQVRSWEPPGAQRGASAFWAFAIPRAERNKEIELNIEM